MFIITGAVPGSVICRWHDRLISRFETDTLKGCANWFFCWRMTAHPLFFPLLFIYMFLPFLLSPRGDPVIPKEMNKMSHSLLRLQVSAQDPCTETWLCILMFRCRVRCSRYRYRRRLRNIYLLSHLHVKSFPWCRGTEQSKKMLCTILCYISRAFTLFIDKRRK